MSNSWSFKWPEKYRVDRILEGDPKKGFLMEARLLDVVSGREVATYYFPGRYWTETEAEIEFDRIQMLNREELNRLKWYANIG